jgi:HEAT repeat protein
LNTRVQPFQRTIDALAKSHNEAAAPTLTTALAVGGGPVFDGAIAGLVARRSKAGHLAVLRHWTTLSPAQKQMVEKGRPRMGGALREALLEGDDQLFEAARDFVEASGDFDLIPTLVMVAEQANGQHAQAAIDLTMRLVDQLCRWIESNREPNTGRDPETIRYCVLESLERSVERFRDHQRSELLEAFVVLAGPHSGTLLAILDNPLHPCFKSVVHTLSNSFSPGVLKLLITVFSSKDAPQIVRNVISKRTDKPFVDVLLAMPVDLKNMPLKRNLARTKSIACCEAVESVCSEFPPEQQAAAMKLMAASGAADEQKLALVEALLRHGSLAGRVAACTALHMIPGQRANKLVLQALQDTEGAVQAIAVRQLRERRIPGTMNKLMELIDSHDEAVSTAARDALSEFSFDNYNTRFDVLDEEARRAMGTRVARVDRTTVARLKQELANPARRQRLRAMEMAAAMGVMPQMADALIERLEDEDHLVRVAAAEALQFCAAGDVRSALLTAVGDRSVAVQNAAKSSLRVLGADVRQEKPAPVLVAEGAP